MGMSIIPLLVTATLFTLGVVLVVVGWRGRRVDDRPSCRRCHHELTGIDLASACPECGRPLDAPRAVRIGRRRRRWIVLSLGAVLVLSLPAVSGLRATNVGRTGWLQNAPTWVLIQGELRRSDPVAIGETLDELLRRATAGDLSNATIVEIAERGVARRLAIAAPDPFGPPGDEAAWTPAWGAFVDAAAAAGSIPDETFVEYVLSGLRVEYTADRSVQARVIHPRAITRRTALAPARVLRLATDGGPPVLVDSYAVPRLQLETRLSDVRVNGEPMMRGSTSSSSTHGLDEAGFGTSGPHLTLPDDAPTGTLEASMTITVRLVRPGDATDEPLWEGTGRLRGPITILAEDVAYDRDAIAAAIRDSITRAFVMDDESNADDEDSMIAVGLDVVFDRVRWRIGWQTRIAGDDASVGGHGSSQIDGRDRYSIRFRGADPTRRVERLRLEVEGIELLDPVLAPAPDALGNVPGMTLMIDVAVEPPVERHDADPGESPETGD